jgi:hypothetical protein
MRYRRYQCAGCNLVFVTDLEPTEIAHCPLCAHCKPAPVDEFELELCSRCGLPLTSVDVFHCEGCGDPLCNECAHIFHDSLCARCERPEDELQKMPCADWLM